MIANGWAMVYSCLTFLSACKGACGKHISEILRVSRYSIEALYSKGTKLEQASVFNAHAGTSAA